MSEMKISNTLVNDTNTGEIAYARQLKDNAVNYTQYAKITAAIKERFHLDDKFQDILNNFFLYHYDEFHRFLEDDGVDPTIIDSWKEVQDFLEGLPDDETTWLKNKLTQLDNRITAMDIPDGGAYDVSADHVDGSGDYAVYASPSDAINAIPPERQKRGMTVRYIDSDTNEYMTYRLISAAWSTNVDDWQREDDVIIVNRVSTDLDITDDQGNVLVRMANGHIKTKNFDSSKNATTEERGLMSAEDKTVLDASAIKLATVERGAEVNDIATDEVEGLDLSFSDENGNILAQFKNGHIKTKNFDSANMDVSTDDTADADLTLSDEAGNVIVMFKDGHIRTKEFDSKSIVPDNENPLSIVKETAGMTSIIHRLGVIGASFSVGGHNKTSGTFPTEIGIEFSWPQRLAALCGITAFNFGKAGIWTKRWLDDTDGFYTAIADTDKKCDAYIISMSSNDTDSSKADYGLGTISDVHVGSESENGATYYGYLSKIVARCHEVMPRAYLFIMTYPNNYAEMEDNGYNQAMRDVCAAYKNAGYKMYMIDYARYGMTIGEAKQKNMFRVAHYVGAGYQYMTYEICTYIDWIIRNNMSDFKDIAFVRTNAECN